MFDSGRLSKVKREIDVVLLLKLMSKKVLLQKRIFDDVLSGVVNSMIQIIAYQHSFTSLRIY